MAQRIRTLLVDDLDGGDADETITFSIEGSDHEIDLSSANAQQLRGALAQFIEAARVVSGRRRARPALPQTSRVQQPEAGVDGRSKVNPLAFSPDVRDWARSAGWPVASSGRMSNTVIAAYESRTVPKAKTRSKKAR